MSKGIIFVIVFALICFIIVVMVKSTKDEQPKAVLDIGLELSSMGIRVDEDSLKEQLVKAGCEERAELPFQKAVLEGELPYTVGGGIGQSRICMFFLRKAHIGEVQASIWPDGVRAEAEAHNIHLL